MRRNVKLTYHTRQANGRHDRLLTHTNRRLRALRAGVTVQGWIDNAEAMLVLLKPLIAEQFTTSIVACCIF